MDIQQGGKEIRGYRRWELARPNMDVVLTCILECQFTGKVSGLRSLGISIQNPQLHSISLDGVWKPGTNEASCSMLNYDGFDDPWLVRTIKKPIYKLKGKPTFSKHMKQCDCGFYVTKDYQELSLSTTILGIAGSASLWGTVVEHDKGWRGQYARIESLIQNPLALKVFGQEYDILLDNLSNKYNVPIIKEGDL